MEKKKRKSEIKIKIYRFYRHREAKGDGKKGINEERQNKRKKGDIVKN